MNCSMMAEVSTDTRNAMAKKIPIITPIFGNYSVTPIIVNKDITYVMVEGYIHGIYDSIRIDANSYVGINPPGFEYFSKTFNGEINPQSKEIVTTIPFYNEEEKDYDWTGIFNFEADIAAAIVELTSPTTITISGLFVMHSFSNSTITFAVVSA